MVFPERPTCHAGEQLVHLVELAWRPPDAFLPVRTCSYCGSMHPEDLLRVLTEGARLSGSDWKYGWPHKFYVDGIPNPHAGEIVDRGSESRGSVPADYQPTAEESAAGWHVRHFDNGVSILERAILGPAPGTLGGKWYNAHLLDAGYDGATRDHLIEQLAQAGGILFQIRDGKLYYQAPYAGYQHA